MEKKSSFHFKEGEILLLNKPKEWSSFDVVSKVRRICKEKKVGHAGTLDPLATGLLIICTGKKTKTISEIQDAEKEYIVGFRFGATTPSFDAEFPPENEKDCSYLTVQMINDALPEFRGVITQYPPIFSAVKIDGQRAYKAARKGKEIELRPRQVSVREFELIHFEAPHFAQARIVCSKGTYIRSLVHDLGQKLGAGAFIQELCRTRIGTHLLADAWEIEEFKKTIEANRIP